MLTADLTVQGQRHREIKSGLSVPPRIALRTMFDMARRPRWVWNVLNAPSRSLGNLHGHLGNSQNLTTLAQWISRQFDPTLTWRDLEWIRELWPGKLILKGIMTAEDARIAANEGVDAIVVSNHGGRQLDGAPATIDVLPRIAAAVADRVELLFDGGITSGQSILKALALGARACLIGKAFLYGLGALGEAGVTAAIEILRKELDISMAMTGSRDVQFISPSILESQGSSLDKHDQGYGSASSTDRVRV
jgi:L-lactate dehydrogenase (cytochrome)